MDGDGCLAPRVSVDAGKGTREAQLLEGLFRFPIQKCRHGRRLHAGRRGVGEGGLSPVGIRALVPIPVPDAERHGGGEVDARVDVQLPVIPGGPVEGSQPGQVGQGLVRCRDTPDNLPFVLDTVPEMAPGPESGAHLYEAEDVSLQVRLPVSDILVQKPVVVGLSPRTQADEHARSYLVAETGRFPEGIPGESPVKEPQGRAQLYVAHAPDPGPVLEGGCLDGLTGEVGPKPFLVQIPLGHGDGFGQAVHTHGSKGGPDLLQALLQMISRSRSGYGKEGGVSIGT